MFLSSIFHTQLLRFLFDISSWHISQRNITTDVVFIMFVTTHSGPLQQMSARYGRQQSVKNIRAQKVLAKMGYGLQSV